MGSNARLGAIVAAIVLAIAVSTALAVRHIRNSDPNAGLAAPVARPPDRGSSQTNGAALQSFDHFAVIAERDVFRPLVGAPKPQLNVPNVPSPSRSSAHPAAAPKPPIEDLAMTGVVQCGGKAQVLLQNIKTGETVYATEGGTAFELKVTKIEARRVTLTKDGQEYTLNMGEKELPKETSEASRKAFTASPAQQPSPSGQAQGSPSSGARFGGRRPNLAEWERRLEEAHNSGRMSDEQYARAKRYMEMRRRGGGR